jgi:predicted transcriptional regulator
MATVFERAMYERQYIKQDYQHRLLLIRNILTTMREIREAVKPSDLLDVVGTWFRVRKYILYLLERGIITEDHTSPRVIRRGRSGTNYYSITEKGYQLLQKIGLLENFCNLEKL